MSLDSITSILLLAFGFGFVVFFHELGHFLAAKWAGVKVEQFAVGFGQALLAWRKGLGLRVGTSAKEFKQRVREWLKDNGVPEAADKDHELTEMEIARGAKALGISETEYRINWIPLGGYVKMLGQDDLKPGSEAEDPRAYNRQTIGKRMVIVSAGVIMNVILAAILFMVLFSIGFHVPPARVGGIQPGSPAQLAGMQVGDEIVLLDGKKQYDDWTKVQLNSALAASEERIPVQVRRIQPDGQEQLISLEIVPRKGGGPSKDFVGLGIETTNDLRGVDAKDGREIEKAIKESYNSVMPGPLLIRPGDVITHVGEKPVDVKKGYPDFDRALQASYGNPVELTVRRENGTIEKVQVQPEFATPFREEVVNFGGLTPRQRVRAVTSKSKAADKVQAGDVLLEISRGPTGDVVRHPTFAQFRATANAAGNADQSLSLKVLRGGQEVAAADVKPISVSRDYYGVGMELLAEPASVTALPLEGSPARAAGIPAGARITKVGGRDVATWYEVHRVLVGMSGLAGPTTAPATQPAVLSATPAAMTVAVTYVPEGGEARTVDLPLSAEQVTQIAQYRYTHPLRLGNFSALKVSETVRIYPPLEAPKMGAIETRDFILQFYLTLKRMVTADISAKNLMGPVGIFHAGTNIAERGTDWLIWFLAMISANLAVVNFLPIPIVDGGLFTFLIIEKIKGKPLSPKTMAIAQYVGLALLLGIVVFVTYQDIMRLIYPA